MRVCDCCGSFVPEVVNVGKCEFCKHCAEEIKEVADCEEYIKELEKEALNGN